MRLRLYHHADGARVAYRETGTGRALVLLHSLGLSHREWEPIVEPLAQRFRVVLPDLPMHGDSEDRPRHPYSREWFIEVLAGFCAEVGGPRICLAGHDVGAELALAAVADGRLAPHKLVLMSHRLEHPSPFPARRALWRATASLGAVPGVDLAVSHLAPLVFRPALGERLSYQANPGARDLLRHALADVPGNANRARAWAKFARRWPAGTRAELEARLEALELPVLLLWAENDPAAPLAWAETALEHLRDGQLRTVPAAGFLMAYDDPVVLARELIAFLG
ncbi:MAG TPA: alpha/beta hydrolase [Solirubrobacteraceae bacterium]|nr:alpha/beta hydrolase [Solirubrobacteraceae bacterium]